MPEEKWLRKTEWKLRAWSPLWTAEVAINQFIMEKMSYNPETDLIPVTLAVRLPFVLVTNPSHPYSTAAELVAYAKKNPDKVTYASSGPGTPQHLAAVLLEQLSGVKIIHVPYKGVAPSIADLLAGHVDIGFVGLPAGLPHIQTGALKALGVSSKTASPAAPKIPPLAATPALDGFELNQWFGVFVPTGAPDAVVQRIQKDIAACCECRTSKRRSKNKVHSQAACRPRNSLPI